MKNWIKPLTALFVIQLVLVVLLNASKFSSNSPAGTKLLATAPSEASKILIETEGEDPLTLAKIDGKWQLPDYYGLAVDPAKIDGFIEKLSTLESSWPTAHTTSAQERFEVAEDKYQRRISLFYDNADKPDAIVYFGTSPGYRKTHARLADSDDIYTVKFSNFEASTASKSWFDSKLLGLEASRINRIESPQYTLVMKDGNWQVTDLAEHEVTESGSVQTYVTQLANLSVEEALTDDPENSVAKLEPQLSLTVNVTGSDPVTYSFALPDPATHYVVKSSLSNIYFRLPKAQGDQLVEMKREQLVKHVVSENEQPVADSAESKEGDQEAEISVPENPAALN
ncbi:MAG: DUF4340 domain-containing protein [Gammaproteobacteria bacterium]